MNSTFASPVEVLLSPSANITQHLQQQVGIVCDLFELHQDRISKLEQDWIQNAISYTNHTLAVVASHEPPQEDETRFHRRLPSFQTLTSRQQQLSPQTALWSSQLTIAMQNLNSAMNMLSSYTRVVVPATSPVVVPTSPRSTACLEDIETNRYLNRIRSRGDSVGEEPNSRPRDEPEDNIFKIRARNILLRKNAQNTASTYGRKASEDSKPPTALVETVEMWRQKADDALSATMTRYRDHEATGNTATEPGNASSVTADQGHTSRYVEMPADTSTFVTSPTRQRQFSSSTHGVCASGTSSPIGPFSNISADIPQRTSNSGQPSSPPRPQAPLHARYFDTPPPIVTGLSPHNSQGSNMSSTQSTSSFSNQMSAATLISSSFRPSLTTNFDQNIGITPTTSMSPSDYAPEVSHFPLPFYGEANVSSISLCSARVDQIPSPRDLRIDSVISLPPGLSSSGRDLVSGSRHEVSLGLGLDRSMLSAPTWQDSRSSSTIGLGRGLGPEPGKQRKSAGRAWLERAMMSDD